MLFYINEIFREKIYSILGIFAIFSFIISSVIMIISYYLVEQQPYSEKTSTYECGFEPFEDARNKFDVRFYIVAILFLIFDIEILYLFP
jgi:NADH-quinone oxidoreductase subunit A